jgi:predicted O-methyltransferase YrrM
MEIKTDRAIQDVLTEYDRRIQDEDVLRRALSRQEWLRRRDEFLLEVGESTAMTMNILARGMKAKTILEIGTSYGYSTIWLAEAARATGGKVITLDLSADKQRYAQSMLRKAGLDGYVEFRCGDALVLIKEIVERLDLVLIDLWKDVYIPCFDAVRSNLAPDAIVIADNMIYPPDNHDMALAYRKHVRQQGMDSVLLPVGHGIEISTRGEAKS